MLVDNDSFRFLLQLQLHGTRGFRRTRVYDPHTRTSGDGVLIDAYDLSHAEVISSPEPGGQRRVIQAGPRRLWDSVESTHATWLRLGKPRIEQFGVTAHDDADHQYVWYDHPESTYRWPLPM